MKFHYNYVIESQKDFRLYYGCSNDLVRRIKEHNDGLVKATKTISHGN